MFEDDVLAGQTAVVTGASRGIGNAIARTFAAHGADVVAAARSADDLDDLVSDLESSHGVRALAVPTDVRDMDSIDALADEAAAFGDGSVEMLVANAGANFHVGVEEMSDNAFDTIVDINLNGTFRCCHAFADALTAADGGRVVTMSSVYGRDGEPESSHYASAKAGIETFTRTLAMEWAERDVRANCIRPGFVVTPGFAENRDVSVDDVDRTAVDRTLGLPEEIADLALFLVSPAASYVTGQTYTAEGVPRVGH